MKWVLTLGIVLACVACAPTAPVAVKHSASPSTVPSTHPLAWPTPKQMNDVASVIAALVVSKDIAAANDQLKFLDAAFPNCAAPQIAPPITFSSEKQAVRKLARVPFTDKRYFYGVGHSGVVGILIRMGCGGQPKGDPRSK